MTVITDRGMVLLTDCQCFAMLDWVGEQSQNGTVLRAFLASIALAALQPGEALALHVRDAEFADDGSGVLLIHPQSQKSDAGKAAGAGTARRVPAGPKLVALLKAEITRRGLRPEDAIFVLDDGCHQPLSPGRSTALFLGLGAVCARAKSSAPVRGSRRRGLPAGT